MAEEIQEKAEEIQEIQETSVAGEEIPSESKEENQEIVEIAPTPKKRGRPKGAVSKKPVIMQAPQSIPQIKEQVHRQPSRLADEGGGPSGVDYDLLARTLSAVMDNRHAQRREQRSQLYNSFF